MKKCTKCKQNKNLCDFPKNTRKGRAVGDGTKATCKKCYNSYFREYFSNKRNMDKQVARVKKNKITYRTIIHKIKVEQGCFICGYNKCATSLHYHHIDPNTKTCNVSKLVYKNVTPEKIKNELDKCILVCANCHGEIEEGLIQID